MLHCYTATHGVQHHRGLGPVTDTRIPLSRDRRDQLKALKRGDETYDELLLKMIRQYDPEEAENNDVPLPDGGEADA